MDTFITGIPAAFSKEIAGQSFVMFSASHIAALSISAASNILLAFLLYKYKSSATVKHFRYWLAAILLLNELYYIVWSIASGDWGVDHSLPVQLCEAAAFAAAAMLLSGSRLLFEPVYFIGLGGGIQALLTPDLYYPFPHSRFISFFLGHTAVITAIIYMLAVYNYRPSLKSIGKTAIGCGASYDP